MPLPPSVPAAPTPAGPDCITSDTHSSQFGMQVARGAHSSWFKAGAVFSMGPEAGTACGTVLDGAERALGQGRIGRCAPTGPALCSSPSLWTLTTLFEDIRKY